VPIVTDAEGRADEENQRQIDKEKLDQTQLEQPGHGAIPGRRVRVADAHDTAGRPALSRPIRAGGLIAFPTAAVMMEGRFSFLPGALNRLDERLVFRESANMSEMTLQPGLSDGLEGIWPAVVSLCQRLELARLESKSESQIREIASLTEEIEGMMHRQIAICDSRLSDMKWSWNITWKSVGRVPGMTWTSGGRMLQEFFDISIRSIEMMHNRIEECEKILRRPIGLDRIDQILAQARQFRADLKTNWLWITKEAEDEAKASMARGEGMDVEEAFAEMMGLPLEQLRAKVEAHRRKYHPTGNGVG
jgi:hypothetical protein